MQRKKEGFQQIELLQICSVFKKLLGIIEEVGALQFQDDLKK